MSRSFASRPVFGRRMRRDAVHRVPAASSCASKSAATSRSLYVFRFVRRYADRCKCRINLRPTRHEFHACNSARIEARRRIAFRKRRDLGGIAFVRSRNRQQLKKRPASRSRSACQTGRSPAGADQDRRTASAHPRHQGAQARAGGCGVRRKQRVGQEAPAIFFRRASLPPRRARFVRGPLAVDTPPRPAAARTTPPPTSFRIPRRVVMADLFRADRRSHLVQR